MLRLWLALHQKFNFYLNFMKLEYYTKIIVLHLNYSYISNTWNTSNTFRYLKFLTIPLLLKSPIFHAISFFS